MVARVKFWLLESSSSIDKASLSVMMLKSSFLYSLFTTRPFLQGRQHLLLGLLNGSKPLTIDLKKV